MNVAELAVILEHCPDDLPVRLTHVGECWTVTRRTHADIGTDPAIVLSGAHYTTLPERIHLRGPYLDRRTLGVRLDVLGGHT